MKNNYEKMVSSLIKALKEKEEEKDRLYSEINELKLYVKELELKIKNINPDKVEEVYNLCVQTQKMMSATIDKINKRCGV